MLQRRRILITAAAVLVGILAATTAYADFLGGTTPLSRGDASMPVAVITADPGTLLATVLAPFSFATTAGTTSGTVRSAVYMNASGTLDFYYQIQNNAISATALARATIHSFIGSAVAVAYRPDGASLPATPGFVNGTILPVTADLDASSIALGFNFIPLPPGTKIPPGTTTVVLIVSTDAVMYSSGNFSISDGGGQTVTTFVPATPE